MPLPNIATFILSLLAMFAAGGYLVNSLVVISRFLRLSGFAVAFIVMSLATSVPELFVGIAAGLEGKPSLSLGNIIGSNIADIALIGGITIVLARGIQVRSRLVRRDALWMTGTAALPVALFAIGNQLSRIDAVILMAAFIGYTWYMAKSRRDFSAPLDDQLNRWRVIGSVLLFAASITALFISAKYAVESGAALALDLGAPNIFVGLFFLAVGSSLPELVFGVQAVLKHRPELNLGNLMGSVVVNSTLILAVTAFISPISANFLLFMSSSAFMLVACFLWAVFTERRGFTLNSGIALILFYVLFLLVELNLRAFAV
ncbi:sodium:calcium antiporter [Candidatus Woesearchaeota archaeon]|nr:sodium:calcium antiporter [Candidatus Woesearchaeota archaeon]